MNKRRRYKAKRKRAARKEEQRVAVCAERALRFLMDPDAEDMAWARQELDRENRAGVAE
jgi:hypothetical protein